MAGPAYTLNLTHFEELLSGHGYSSKADFIKRSGIPRSTFFAILAGERDVNGFTISYFLDSFPGTAFEYLFERTERAA